MYKSRRVQLDLQTHVVWAKLTVTGRKYLFTHKLNKLHMKSPRHNKHEIPHCSFLQLFFRAEPHFDIAIFKVQTLKRLQSCFATALVWNDLLLAINEWKESFILIHFDLLLPAEFSGKTHFPLRGKGLCVYYWHYEALNSFMNVLMHSA